MMPPELVDKVVSDRVTAEQEEWFHRCMVAGRQKTALEWLESTGDFATRTDRRGRTVAARMLSVLGDSRGSELLHLRNYRAYPDDPTAVFYGAFSLDRRFGPLTALDRIGEYLESVGNRALKEVEFANLWAFRGALESRLRDFSRAYDSIAKARELDPEDMWIAVQQSRALLHEDRPGEALEVAEEALSKTPNYWPPLADVADLYWAQNRDEEALALLERSLRDNEGPGPARRLVHCFDEIEAYDRGLEVLSEYERRVSRADRETRKWIEANRASFLYQTGKGKEMLPHAEKADFGFYKKVAKRVKSGKYWEGKRLRLNVPFVRQNDLTCAPATLTAIARYFGEAADHLEIAEEICYNGTSDYKERLWAEQQGWYVKEFRADWDTTRSLIDAGLPFTLATVEPTSAHLQAVIGYDSRAGTVIIRDPGHRHYQESIAKSFFKDYAHCGPRGMVLVPREKVADLERIDLPEMAEYDLVYEINRHLESHERDEALTALKKLGEIAPESRIYDQGALNLSYYDGDQAAGLEIAERMQKRFPKSIRWEYALYCRRYNRTSREERLEFLRKKTNKKSVFTLYFKEYAELLAEDARMMEEAAYQFRRSVRYRRQDPEVYYGLAGALWKQREFERATELYRIASCLSERNEQYADSYFLACRWVRRPEEGITTLRRRYERFGEKSGSPAITLANALRKLDRDTEVSDLMENALKRAPDDGDLISYAAVFFAGIRNYERAQSLLEAAKGKISEVERHRVLARIADLDSKPAEALQYWRKVSEAEPLAMDAHRAIAALLNRSTNSDQESIGHLEASCREHPYYVPLHECLVGWLRDRGPGEAEEALRNLVEKHPSNAWGWRELALDLGAQLKFDEAQKAAKKSVDLCPEVSWSYSIRGVLFEDARNLAAARKYFREALELDIENSSALKGFVRVSSGIEKKREALQFIEKQLKEQVIFGETIHSYRQIAFSVIEPEELLESLKRANEARPDLWQTWSALADQFLAMGLLDEAHEYATQLTERFPMMPRSWLDLAEVFMHKGDREAEIATLEQCLTLNPQWDLPLRRMADALEVQGEPAKAVEMLERALKEDPLSSPNYGCLADLLWKMGRRDEAFEVLLRGVRIDPSYNWGWDRMAEWSARLDRKKEAIEEGKRLTKELPLNWFSWQRLADLYGENGEGDRRIEVLEEGLEQLPLSTDLRDYHAWVLCQSGRYQAALDACSESHWPEGGRPRNLACREAWVEGEMGRRDEAIRKMELVVADHPDYYWAHENLVNWYAEEEEFEKAEKAARQLVRLGPMDPEAHGTLADLLLKQKKQKEAREELERAFSLSHDYAYAGYQLVKIDLEAKDYSSANDMLQILEFNHPDLASCFELRCRLETAMGNQDAAYEAFSDLCRASDVAEATLERAEQALMKLGKPKRIVKAYRKNLDSGEVESDAVILRWLKRVVSAERPNSIVAALSSMPLTESLHEAGWQGFVYELEALGKRRKALSVIRSNRSTFRGNTRLWASAGYLLRQENRRSELRKWMEGWEEREGLRPWMLMNLAHNELLIGGVDAAGPLHKFASEEIPEEHDTWQHYACAAYYEASCGRIENARDFLERAEVGPMHSYFSAVTELARFRIEAAESEGGRGDLFSQALETYPQWAQDKEFRVYLRHLLRTYRWKLFSDRRSRSGAIHASWVCFANLDLW